MGDAHLQEGASPVEHVEDCPAERGDCTCGGYVQLSVAEALADACQAVDSHYSASLDFQPIYVHLARKALAAYRPADQLRKEEPT